MTSLKRALGRVPGLRRVVQPARRIVHQVRIRRTGPDALVRAPGTALADLRWAARTAQDRGDADLAGAALLLLVTRGGANDREQRLIRASGHALPVPAGPPSSANPAGPPSSAGTVTDGAVLVLRREPAGTGVRASITGPAGAAPADETVAAWQPAWAQLPAPLAEQLTVCALTRIASQRAVTEVHAADRDTVALAGAVADAVGAPLRTTTPSQEPGR